MAPRNFSQGASRSQGIEVNGVGREVLRTQNPYVLGHMGYREMPDVVCDDDASSAHDGGRNHVLISWVRETERPLQRFPADDKRVVEALTHLENQALSYSFGLA